MIKKKERERSKKMGLRLKGHTRIKGRNPDIQASLGSLKWEGDKVDDHRGEVGLDLQYLPVKHCWSMYNSTKTQYIRGKQAPDPQVLYLNGYENRKQNFKIHYFNWHKSNLFCSHSMMFWKACVTWWEHKDVLSEVFKPTLSWAIEGTRKYTSILSYCSVFEWLEKRPDLWHITGKTQVK